jgi:DNA repair exonuclease SbcCD nuclease subunit
MFLTPGVRSALKPCSRGPLRFSVKAALRRSEQRELLGRLAELSRTEKVGLVLLSGDLLDSDNSYYETGEELSRCLAGMAAPVFISPGNHDYYSPRSPWKRFKLPGNVCLFTENRIRGVTLSSLNLRVYGAAFTENRSGPLLQGFRAERTEGVTNLLCLHGEVGARGSAYDPITVEELAQSGMDYAALGHVHKTGGLLQAGKTWYSWPGCPEGRGFDETGDRFVNLVELENGQCRMRQVSIALRRYEQLQVDVTGTDPLLAIHSSLPDDTVCDVYRITLVGETDAAPDLRRLYQNLSELFFELQLRDETRLRRGIWDCVGEDTLRGLFLGRLKARFDAAATEEERVKLEQAARWGLAALDNGEEVAQHEDQ